MREIIRVNMLRMLPVMEELFARGSGVCITVTGMSMYPFLRDGIDRVELSPCDFQGMRVCDIALVCTAKGEYILHRVLWKSRGGIYLVGDAQYWPEGPFTQEQVFAVVTAVWRKEKKIDTFSRRWRFLSCLWIIMLPFRKFAIKAFRLLGKFK